MIHDATDTPNAKPSCAVVHAGSNTRSNVAEARPERVLSLCGIRLHVASSGNTVDLARRRPAAVLDVTVGQAPEKQAAE
jgi:cyanophycinase